MPVYSIVVPAYNERERILSSLGRIFDFLATQRWDAEVIVVNDGSRDDTAALVAACAEREPRLRLLDNPGNRGKGYSVRHGMLAARGDLLIFTHWDRESLWQQIWQRMHALAEG